MRSAFLLSSGIVTLGLLACSSDNSATFKPSASLPAGSSLFAAASPVPDLSGAWTWKAAGRLTVPISQVEALFGIQPEGPITHLRCESTGTMALSQTAAAFEGLATRTGVTCETGRGLVFTPPARAFPNSLPVVDGSITGRALHFLLGFVAGAGCPHNGAITEVHGTTATTLKASGRCIIPGHPQSPVPLDPPPSGTSHDTSFVAIRP